MPETNPRRAIMLMLLAMFCFGVNDVMLKLALVSLPLGQVLVLRGIPAFLLIALIAWRSGAFSCRLQPGDGRMIFWRSLSEVGVSLSFLTAVSQMPLATATAILQSMPLMATLAAMVFLGEQVGWRRLVAISIGFLGVLIVIRPGAEGFNPYALMVVLAVVLLVWREMLTRQMRPGIPAALTALGATVAVLFFASVLASQSEWQSVPPEAAAALAVSAFMMTAGFLTIVACLKAGSISTTAPLRYTQLLWGILLAMIFFAEVPDLLTLAGAALIVGSGVFTMLREARQQRLSEAAQAMAQASAEASAGGSAGGAGQGAQTPSRGADG